MKKVIIFLLGVCFAINTLYAQPVETPIIDKVATAKASWKIGDVIPNTRQEVYAGKVVYVYRQFLGITATGYYLVQDFYEEKGQKMTDPYAIMNRDEVDGEGKRLYDDQKIDGYYTHWYLNGQKAWQALFVNGKKEGLEKSWGKTGGRQSEGYYESGLREGAFISWYSNDQKMAEESYKNGVPEGHWKEWNQDGSKKLEGYYANGVKEGLWAEWGNGILQYKGPYVNGHKEGMWYEYDLSYGIASHGSYKKDVKEGLWKQWWYACDGAQRSEGNYRNGLRQGNWTLWSDCNEAECPENTMSKGRYENDEQVGVWEESTFKGLERKRIISVKKYKIGN